MYSIIFATAIFIAVLLNDILEKIYSRLAFHAFLGGIVVTLVSILWYLNYEFVGWALLVLPIVSLIISYIVIRTTSKAPVSPMKYGPPASTFASASGSLAGSPICTQNPAGPYTAVAQPAPSSVSLPASLPVTDEPANSSASRPPSFKITPLTNDSC